MYELRFARKAAKFYQKTDVPTARRLNRIFGMLEENPFGHPGTKQLKGELAGSLRIRIGNVRIIFSVDEEDRIVYIEVIGYRGNVYK